MRSARSAACSSENEVGENRCLFLPRLVVCRTTGEEFHSVKATRYPRLTSHLCSRSSWVLLPEPSMPSTIKSFPRSAVPSGNVAIVSSTGRNIQLAVERGLEECRIPLRFPNFHARIRSGSHLGAQHHSVAGGVQHAQA